MCIIKLPTLTRLFSLSDGVYSDSTGSIFCIQSPHRMFTTFVARTTIKRKFDLTDENIGLLNALAKNGVKESDWVNVAILESFLPVSFELNIEASYIFDEHEKGYETDESYHMVARECISRGIKWLAKHPIQDVAILEMIFGCFPFGREESGKISTCNDYVQAEMDKIYKVCANDVLDRRELRNFHPDLQKYLNDHGLEDAHVMTGVTRTQGGNRTVRELKAEREREYEQQVERPALYFGESSGPELHF